VDESRRFDERQLDGDEWMKWAERNLSARELELMRLANCADRGRPVSRRVPAAV
jgi:hypothetical protein